MMKKKIILILIVMLTQYSVAEAGEFSGKIGMDGRVYINGAVHSGQDGNTAGSLVFQPEYYHQFKNSALSIIPFARIDGEDEERAHYDIREFSMLFYGDNWEFKAGISKVFWGVTESQHLVDIINQTDLVENINYEEKLGQPMVQVSFPSDLGTFELIFLPYFRERTFPGKKGRLRSSIVVDTDNPVYESSRKENHLDGAVRYSHTIGDWDLGIYHFQGTNREPTMTVSQDSSGNPVLVPYYEQINQSGLDLLTIIDEWILKLESIYRAGQGNKDYYALTTGFEYTFSGGVGGADIGVLSEWLYDERGEGSTVFDNDIMGGLRIGFNDASSTEVLFGIIHDYKNKSKIFNFESSRRLSDNFKISLTSSFFIDPSPKDPLNDMRNDDHVELGVLFYY